MSPALGIIDLPALTVTLDCEDAVAARALSTTFAALLRPAAARGETWSVKRDDDAFTVRAPGRSLDGRRCVSTTSLVSRLQAELNNALPSEACAAGYVLLHAGTLVLDEAATVLLVGTSGAGKTTLTATLVAQGARYLSDEFAVLEPSTRTVHGYLKPLTVKQGARELLSAYPQLGAAASLVDHEDPGMRHVPLPSSMVRRRADWPAALFLLDTDPDAQEGWQHPADAVIELAEHSPCRAQTTEQFPHLADLAREVPAYRLPRAAPEHMAARTRDVTEAAQSERTW